MVLQTSKELQSTSYRCLFEGIKSEGIEPFLKFAKDIEKVSKKEHLIRQTIFSNTNDLAALKKNNRDIIKYFKSHKEELIRLDLTNENVFNILERLANDISPLDLYIENARRLEDLKVQGILFESFWDFNKGNCGIYRNEQGKIIHISKYYTDGQIVSSKNEIVVDPLFHYSKINFSIHNESFILRVENTENFYSIITIYIKDFGFDATKLPLPEELQKYEIPNELIRKRVK